MRERYERMNSLSVKRNSWVHLELIFFRGARKFQ